MSDQITFVSSNSELSRIAQEVVRQEYGLLTVFRIPNIVVILDDVEMNLSKGYGSVTAENPLQLILRLQLITRRNPDDFVLGVKLVFTHEYIHLLQMQGNNLLLQWKKRHEKLRNLLPALQSSNLGAEYSYPRLRLDLFEFHKKLYTEGISYFLESYLENDLTWDLLSHSKEQFLEGYEYTSKQFTNFNSRFTELISAIEAGQNVINVVGYKEIETVIEKWPYYFGADMIRAILFLDKSVTVKDLMDLDPDRFIVLYEKVMLNNNYRPLFSLGPSGVLSYKALLKQLVESYGRFMVQHKGRRLW